jgi:hypothetical protein
MTEINQTPAAEMDPELTLEEQFDAISYEPLLSIEKKLVAWCLILGVVLLGMLLWASATFFPIAGQPPVR